MVYHNLLKLEGPKRKCFPEPTTYIIVVEKQSVEQAISCFLHLGFKIVTGIRYLGGHIREDDCCVDYVKKKIEELVERTKTLTK